MFAFCCPLCGSSDIVIDQLVNQLRLLGIDPDTGDVSIGKAIREHESEPHFRFYHCRGCEYLNIDKMMFIKKDAA